jgi:hypothetical protein
MDGLKLSVRDGGLSQWSQVYAIDKPGQVIDCFRQQLGRSWDEICADWCVGLGADPVLLGPDGSRLECDRSSPKEERMPAVEVLWLHSLPNAGDDIAHYVNRVDYPSRLAIRDVIGRVFGLEHAPGRGNLTLNAGRRNPF